MVRVDNDDDAAAHVGEGEQGRNDKCFHLDQSFLCKKVIGEDHPAGQLAPGEMALVQNVRERDSTGTTEVCRPRSPVTDGCLAPRDAPAHQVRENIRLGHTAHVPEVSLLCRVQVRVGLEQVYRERPALERFDVDPEKEGGPTSTKRSNRVVNETG